MRPYGGARLPAFAEQGNFGRARIVRLPSCKCGRAREAGKTPRAGVSGAGESIQNQKSKMNNSIKYDKFTTFFDKLTMFF